MLVGFGPRNPQNLIGKGVVDQAQAMFNQEQWIFAVIVAIAITIVSFLTYLFLRKELCDG